MSAEIAEIIIQNLTQEEFIRYYSLIIQQISSQDIKGRSYQKEVNTFHILWKNVWMK